MLLRRTLCGRFRGLSQVSSSGCHPRLCDWYGAKKVLNVNNFLYVVVHSFTQSISQESSGLEGFVESPRGATVRSLASRRCTWRTRSHMALIKHLDNTLLQLSPTSGRSSHRRKLEHCTLQSTWPSEPIAVTRAVQPSSTESKLLCARQCADLNKV